MAEETQKLSTPPSAEEIQAKIKRIESEYSVTVAGIKAELKRLQGLFEAQKIAIQQTEAEYADYQRKLLVAASAMSAMSALLDD
jgi:hypothetical protein